ncbi:ATP-dependent DNA helicase II subunit 2 [Podila epigama]|nr:ATP-dependent DNA helicase II subunit 2 [Podila epigama]
MATKEATVYILDVGPTLKAKREGSKVSRLEETKAILLKLLANKVHMNRKTVYVSVVLVGSNRTNNDLANVDENGADYQFVDVLQSLDIATLELMKGVQNDVDFGETMGDCMDGLIVAADMMTKFCRHLKYEKKIFILTDACAEVNPDGVEHIQQSLQDDKVQLNVIGTDFDSEDGTSLPKTQMQAQNEQFFNNLCEATGGSVFSLDEALDLTSEFYTKKVKPTAVYRGTLDLGDPEGHPDSSLSIPVHMFASTMTVSLPTAKKYSMLSESAAADDLPGGRSGLVNQSRSYKLKVTAADLESGDVDANMDTEVSVDDLEKAYMYGKTIVPIRAVDLEAYKLRTARGLTILGFFSASTFKRDWLMSNVYAIFPAPGNPSAEVEMAGLLFGMFEKNSYALCRYVRTEDAEPKLAVLWPEITAETKCFYFGQVAFSEDIRQYLFASLTNLETATGKKIEKHRLLATPDMISAAKSFINALDLMTANNGEEYLRPEDTFNPAVQRHKQLVEFRALNPDATEFPPVPSSLMKQLLPLPEMMEAAQPLADELIRLWDIKKVEKQEGKRGYAASLENDKDGVVGGQLSGVDGSGASLFEGLTAGNGNGHPSKRQKSESVFGTATSGSGMGGAGGRGGSGLGGGGQQGDLAASGMVPFEMASVREVGTSDPVKDFQAMVRIATINTQQGVRPAGAGWITVSLAVDQMKAMVIKLITTSFGDQLYEKAIDCLKSLRSFLSHADFADLAALAGRSKNDVETSTTTSTSALVGVVDAETRKERVETWNEFIRQVKHQCLNPSMSSTSSSTRTDFWQLLVKHHKNTLGLLTAKEVARLSSSSSSSTSVVPGDNGGVSETEAEQFWDLAEVASGEAPVQDQDGPDDDDLLALMD